jgi:hypothetical protein
MPLKGFGHEGRLFLINSAGTKKTGEPSGAGF